MLHLSELLGRFKNIGLGEQLSKDVIVEEINSVLGVNTVSQKDITIKNQIAIIKGGSILKSEIALHKESILDGARNKLGKSFVVKDLR